MSQKKIVTYALPYANGILHLGHMMGMIQADSYVRFLRLKKVAVCFLCGDDAHGTPIMLNAQKKGIDPEALIEKIAVLHQEDVAGFNISFDTYHTTHCPLNTQIVHEVYARLQKAGGIASKSIEQAYDEEKKMFLPDRYVKGSCPHCFAEEQFGDHCEVCGKTYSIQSMINPISTISGKPPVWRSSEHQFFKLSAESAYLSEWLTTATLQESVQHKLQEWPKAGLMDWDITRDAPYFGILIPNSPNQYFYVWLDAPFGYFAALGKHLGSVVPEAVFAAWNEASIVHFIGKDIVSFHGVFWPTVLNRAGLNPPDRLHVHGFLNILGDKMSKSRGTFVSAKAYRDQLPVDLIRYYFASRLSPSVADIDLDWQDFVLKVNSDLVGKLVNIGSRSQGFIHKYFDGCLGAVVDEAVFAQVVASHEVIEQAYADVDLARVCRVVMAVCDEVNQYIAESKPWECAKSEDFEKLEVVVTTAMNAFRYLVYALSPIIPDIASQVASSMQEELVWTRDIRRSGKILPFAHLVTRITESDTQFE